jgi:hypothetical protein
VISARLPSRSANQMLWADAPGAPWIIRMARHATDRTVSSMAFVRRVTDIRRRGHVDSDNISSTIHCPAPTLNSTTDAPHLQFVYFLSLPYQ